MIRLANIKKINDVIECDFYPEDCDRPERLVYNIKTQEAIFKLQDGYEYCKTHVTMGIKWMLDNIDSLPESQVVMWC